MGCDKSAFINHRHLKELMAILTNAVDPDWFCSGKEGMFVEPHQKAVWLDECAFYAAAASELGTHHQMSYIKQYLF